MKNILLVDSYSIANRAYYALGNKMTNADGEDTSVIFGYLTSVLKYIDKYEIDSVIAAFDLREKNFRHDMYGKYKGTRIKMDDTIHRQIDILKEILPVMNVDLVSKSGYEADDIIGTISKIESGKGNKIFILSGDRDLFALVDDNCYQIYTSVNNSGRELFDPKGVEEYFGVEPKYVTSMKALMGDTSDNIPGVHGVGQKTAQKLVEEFGELENILENIDKSSVSPRVVNNIKKNVEDARLSYKLAEICRDINDLKYKLLPFMNGIDDTVLYEKLSTYGLAKIINKLDVSSENSFEISEKNVSEEEIKRVIDTKNMPYEAAFTIYNNEAFIAFPEDDLLYTVTENIGAVLEYLNEGAERILTFDLKEFLGKIPFNRDGRDYFDAKLAAYVIDASQNLDSVTLLKKYAKIEIDLPDYSNVKDTNGKSITKAEVEKLKTRDQFRYGAYFAAKSGDKLNKLILEQDLFQLYYEIEMPLTFVLYDMTKEGIRVDKDILLNYGIELSDRVAKLELEIQQLAGEKFKVNSPKELGRVLFEEMKLPFGKKNKTGWSTSVDVLEKLRNIDPIIEKILEYRQLSKLNNTYISGLIDYVEKDGRIHSKFMQMVTATGRLSSTEPNLQNLPIKSDIGRNLRKAFIPKEGYVFVDADYSQIELRILAHLSEDQAMISDFKNKVDIHSATAARIFEIETDKVTPNQRRSAKAINFGLIYGMGSFSLSEDLHISKKDADDYIKSYFENYAAIKNYLDGQVNSAKKNGFVSTLFNRRRYIPDINSNNFLIRSAAERIAMNTTIQGTASDIMKIAMNNVYHRIKHDKLDAKLILQIHDELLIEVSEKDAKKVENLLKKEMERACKLKVDLEVGLSVGKSMFDLK